MKKAILDLGTNTFNIIIGEITGDGYRDIYSGREIAKLGEGGLHKDIITDEAFERGLTAISRLMEIVVQHKCDEVKAYATSGIRSTSNGADFILEIRRRFGVEVEVISGDREAELIWKGVRLCAKLTEPNLIMDIGGGSTEFILADANTIFWKESFKLGASRLKETFQPHDPISSEDIDTLIRHFDRQLVSLHEAVKHYSKLDLIGSSGSFDTFTEMMLHRQNDMQRLENKAFLEVPLVEFIESYEFLIASTYEQRLVTPGIIPMRADMIVISGLLTKYVIDLCRINQMYLSKYALKEGALSEL